VGAVSTRSVPVGEIRPLGDAALLIGVEDATSARALVHAIEESGVAGLRDVVGGLATVMVSFDPELDAQDPDALLAVVRDLVGLPGGSETAPAPPGKLLTVPTVFDGPDLREVADAAGCSPEAVVDLVTSRLLTVAVVGFSPGFAYLAGLAEELSHIARRPRPRPVVPAGSVALANGHAAIYPTASPGGWQLIGRTEEKLFTPDEAPFARLAPGDQVRFTVASGSGSAPAPARPPVDPGDPSPSDGGVPVFVVEQPGLRTVLQDGGRRGMAAIGVPTAGPADPTSFSLANRLVGNSPEACALEVTAQGPALRCLSPTFVAVVGGSPDVRVGGRSAPPGQVIPVAPGQTVEIGLVRRGLRTYLAVAGGLVGPRVLGSSATDVLSGFGPGPIAAGQRMAAGPLSLPLGDHLADDVMTGPRGEMPLEVRVLPGPHPERFAPGAFESLAERRFSVEEQSNRVGLRLRPADQGPSLAAADTGAALDSQGMVVGAIQGPPDGEPVVLLPDHATLGGYPVIAVVASVDHGLLGQCAPGATLSLRPVTIDGARRDLVTRRRTLRRAVVGHYPVMVE
jgi:KipI family sensor histidine kinase inhibitor